MSKTTNRKTNGRRSLHPVDGRRARRIAKLEDAIVKLNETIGALVEMKEMVWALWRVETRPIRDRKSSIDQDQVRHESAAPKAD